MKPRSTVLVLSVAATLILSTGYAWAGKPPKPDPLEGRVVAYSTRSTGVIDLALAG